MINKIKNVGGKLSNWLFFLSNNDEPDSPNGPSWKFRRKLIFGAYRLSVAMIAFGAIAFVYDPSSTVLNSLITGGVALITIIISAYVASGAYQDVKLFKDKDKGEK